jgi:alkanesulfonate monooxygenase SsuD/methylene tetrahydromethanopterin reductase-like flavin-dependent oxidoreductase (luciferase family)
MIAANVLCAETDEEAMRLSMPGALSFLNLRLGRPGLMPSLAETEAHQWTEAERAFVDDRLSQQIIGSPETARKGIEELVDRTGVDELMITTQTHSPDDRIRSYELVADAMGVAPLSR